MSWRTCVIVKQIQSNPTGHTWSITPIEQRSMLGFVIHRDRKTQLWWHDIAWIPTGNIKRHCGCRVGHWIPRAGGDYSLGSSSSVIWTLGSPAPKGCCWQHRLGCAQLPLRPKDGAVSPVPGLVEPAGRWMSSLAPSKVPLLLVAQVPRSDLKWSPSFPAALQIAWQVYVQVKLYDSWWLLIISSSSLVVITPVSSLASWIKFLEEFAVSFDGCLGRSLMSSAASLDEQESWVQGPSMNRNLEHSVSRWTRIPLLTPVWGSAWFSNLKPRCMGG